MTKSIETLNYNTQRVLPQVYDDTLSHYEVLGKVTGKLNELINKNNEYFSQDFTKFVRNILTQWHDDGTFNTIVNEEIFGDLNNQLTQISANVKQFGAKGDGITDDRKAIQDAIDYVASVGGGKVSFPKGIYLLNSLHPVHDAQLFITSSNITLEGVGHTLSKLKAGSYADSMLLLGHATSVEAEITRTSIIDLGFEGENKVKYNVRGNEKFVPFTNIVRSFFNKAIESNLLLSPYLSTFDNVTCQFSKIGFNFAPKTGDIITSNTFNSCYANVQTVSGYKMTNLTYSTFNSCACDSSELGFDIYGRGVTLNACASEKTKKLGKFNPFFGITINGFYSMYGGGEVATPTDFLFEFGYGTDAVISGVHLQNMKSYNKVLGLTSDTWGQENITILDDSIKRSQVSFVKNFKFNRPIKFLRGDETTKDDTVTKSIVDLREYLTSIQDMEINHTLTIQLSNGVQPTVTDNTWINSITRLKGIGKVIIQGNSTNRELVKLHGAWQQTRIKDCSVTVELKNLTIESRTSGGDGYYILETDNARKVILNNVLLSGNQLNVGSGVYARNGSEVYVSSGTDVLNGNIQDTKYKVDGTSKINS